MDIHEFILETQAAMLRAATADGAETQAARREAATAAFTAAVVDLTEALKPAVVAEVGAHEAAFSRALARRLPDARVIAFEAHPRVHAKWSAACAGAGVDYRNACVSDANGTASFKAPLRGDGSERLFMGSLLEDSQSEGFREYQVETVTLDGALGADAGRPNVLWIDVEGAAGQVLAGARATLKASLAVYVEVETRARWRGQVQAPELTAVLSDCGLRPVLRDIQRAAGEREWQYNVLFLRDELLVGPRPSRLGRLLGLGRSAGRQAPYS